MVTMYLPLAESQAIVTAIPAHAVELVAAHTVALMILRAIEHETKVISTMVGRLVKRFKPHKD